MAGVPTHLREWIIQKKPMDEKLTKEHFRMSAVSLADQPKEEKLLVRILYISNDPAQRTWMDDGPFNHRPYLPPVMQVGHRVFAGTLCEVIEIYNTAGYAVGETIYCHAGWADYALIDPTAGLPAMKVPVGIAPEDYHCLDLTGQSAYFAFFKRAGASQKMRTVVVNAAAGGVGSMVTQFAKNIIGVERVIGICGSDEKCQIIKEQCGVDIALNYKSVNFEAEFVAATPNYIDLFFDNVGGKQLDLGVQRIAALGTILACGAISTYERDEKIAVSGASWMQIIYQQANILGFLIMHYLAEGPAAIEVMAQWVQGGKVKLLKTVYEVPLDEVPDVYRMMFEGHSIGKVVTK